MDDLTGLAILNSPSSRPSELLLHDLLAHNDPAAVAIRYYHNLDGAFREFTYDRLRELSDHYAASLLAEGHFEEIVPVFLPQSPELYVAVLAILKSAFICHDVGAKTCFARKSDDLGIDLHRRLIDLDRALEDAELSYSQPADLRAESVAYCMFTSGSTGTPKGVLITHSAASTSIKAHHDLFCEANGKSMLQFANTTFDISVFEMFSAWAWGMTLVSVKRQILLNDLPRVIYDTKVSHLELTPSIAGLLPDQRDPRMVFVELLITIGEMTTRTIIERWYGKLVNAYGPTEATLHATYARVEDGGQSVQNIGQPLSSCTLVILAENQDTILQPGEIGELCIAGPQLALGYFHRDELTQEVFKYNNALQQRIYRSGDLAMILDGFVYFHGRKSGDEQVKINGQRLELGEIVYELGKSDMISSSAAIMHEHQIIVFVVPKDRKSFSEKCIPALPLNVHPSVCLLDEIPYTAAGKLDRETLLHICAERSTTPSNAEVSFSSAELAIRDAIRSTSGKDLDVHHSFRYSGIDSLTAIKVVMAIRRDDLHIDVDEFLRCDTIHQAAKSLRSASVHEENDDGPLLSDIVTTRLSQRYGDACAFVPCSAIQESTLAATLSHPGRGIYVNNVLFSLGSIAMNLVSDSLKLLVQRHGILRTGFHIAEDIKDCQFVQVIHSATEHTPSVASEVLPELNDIMSTTNRQLQKIRNGIDSLEIPPISFVVVSQAKNTYVSIALHHALYDGWSIDILRSELAAILSGNSLSSSPPQYQHSVQRLIANESKTMQKSQYWDDYFALAECPSFPVLSKNLQEQPAYTVHIESSLTWQTLQRFSQKYGCNPQTVAQLAWGIALRRLCGTEKVCFALTTSGRTLPIKDLDQVFGPFITTYPCRFEFSEKTTLAEIMTTIHNENNIALKHRLSYRDILSLSKTKERPDTLVIYQKSSLPSSSSDLVRIISQEDYLEFATLFMIEEVDNSVRLTLSSTTAVLSEESAFCLLRQLDGFIANLKDAENSTPLSILQRPTADAIDDRTDTPIQLATSLFVALEGANQFCGSDLALQFYENSSQSIDWTYDDLLSRSALIASRLHTSNGIIAICLARCPDLYASILAVLRSGNAYLALEPSLPHDRVVTILRQVQVSCIITDTALSGRFETADHSLVLVDQGEFMKPDKHISNEQHNADLAYILMTSGSTGMPKACAVTQTNVMANCEYLKRYYPHESTGRMLQFASFAFDVSVFEMFYCWLNGMCLVSSSKDLMLSDFASHVSAWHITHLNLTPVAAELLENKSLPNIRCFITSGDMTNEKIIRQWAATKKYFNAYGPTETTNVVTIKHVLDKCDNPKAIGRVLPGSAAFVVTGNLQLCSRFALGELCISGPQVIAGYYNNEDETQSKFITESDRGRYYKTGDLARMLEDGSILICGRKDSQVKVRGHRVELDEISRCLEEAPSVLDATSIVRNDSVVSFVKLEGSHEDTTVSHQLFDHLEAHLPQYMLPKTIVSVSDIPLNTSHKVDRRQLVDILDHEQGVKQFVRQLDGNEDTAQEEIPLQLDPGLLHAICEVTGKTSTFITSSTTIYQLGLDSISAIKLVHLLKRRFGIHFSITDIMKLKRVGAINQLISSQVLPNQDEETGSNLSLTGGASTDFFSLAKQHGIDIATVSDAVPCTSMQIGLVLESSKNCKVSYINHSIMQLQPVPSDRLRRCCEQLVTVHPTLRSYIHPTSDRDHPFLQIAMAPQFVRTKWQSIETMDLQQTLCDWKRNIISRHKVSEPDVSFLEVTMDAPHRQFLVLSMHHSLFDGWSLSLIQNDLAALLRGIELPKRPSLLEIVSQVTALADDKAPLEYWKNYMRDVEASRLPSLTDTIIDVPTIRSYTSKFSLAAIQKSLRKIGANMLPALQLAFARVQQGIIGDSKICFANAVSGRTIDIRGIEELAYPLFNVFPVIVNSSDNRSTAVQLELLENHNIQCLEHPQYPLRKILQFRGQTRENPLFDSILILQPASEIDETVFQSITDDGDSNYLLMLEVVPRPGADELEFRFTTSGQGIGVSTLDTMAQVMDQDFLQIIDAENVHTVELVALTRPASVLNTTDLVHAAFLNCCDQQGERIAIDYINQDGSRMSMSYTQLKAASAQLRNKLMSLHLEKSSAVLVMMSDMPKLSAAFLAILQAGLVYVPIDTKTPPERFKHILQELRAGFILVDELGLKQALVEKHELLPKVLVVESLQLDTDIEPVTTIIDNITPEDPAYIIFTSGSTGVPKAVVIQHKAAFATIESSREFLKTSSNSRWLQFASLTFDMSVYDMLIAFSFGLCLCGAPKETLLNELTKTVILLEITHLDLTPSVARTLKRRDLPLVECLFCIGESLPRSVIEEWSDACLNVYGPTEAAMACTFAKVNSATPSHYIGHPFKYVQFGVFDRNGTEPVNILNLGELCLSGPQLSMGYLVPEQNFDCFFDYDGTRFYRTGDLCRMLPDHSLSFVGRKDSQVKLRGQRVELDEITLAMCRFEGVNDAHTLIVHDAQHNADHLITFVVLSAAPDEALKEFEPLAEEMLRSIKGHLGQSLPLYMIPENIIRIPAMPLGAASKIDRRRLLRIWSKYDTSREVKNADSQEDAYTDAELLVRSLLADLSGVNPSSIAHHTTIYNLGLDSISAMQIVSQLRARKHSIDVLQILQNPTLNEIAKHVQFTSSKVGHQISKTYSKLCEDLLATTGKRLVPCTPIQSNMISQFIQSNGRSYYNHMVFELHDVKLTRLRKAWQAVITKNPGLTAGIVQVEYCNYALHLQDVNFDSLWSQVSLKQLKADVDQYTATFCHDVLQDIGRSSLRLTILEDDLTQYLMFSAHHALYDGTSLQKIFQQVERAYFQNEIEYSHPERAAGILWSPLHDENATHEKFWRDRLDSAQSIAFPNLTNRTDIDQSIFSTHSRRAAVNLEDLLERCKELNMSLQTVAQASWAKLVSAYTGESEFILGVVLSGRTGLPLENDVFPCVTTIPFLVALKGTVRDFLVETRKFMLEALPHQHTAFSKLRSEQSNALFSTLFVYQKEVEDALNCSLWTVKEDIAAVEVPVSLEVIENTIGVTLRLTCKEALVTSAQATMMLDQYEAIMMCMIEDTEQPILELESRLPSRLLSITPAEVEGFDTGNIKLLHEYFEYFAAHTPDAIAFEYTEDFSTEAESWTYTQFNSLANQLARSLDENLELNQKSVAICFDKSPIAFVAILAVLKTGASFCCLDSSAPLERRVFICQNSKAAIVLCGAEFRESLASALEVPVLTPCLTELGKSSFSKLDLKVSQQPSDLSYILYTSGSTGTPKGCCLTHENIVQTLYSFREQFCHRYDTDSRFLAFASLHFDVSILEQYFSWSVGARVCAAPKDVLLSNIPEAIKFFGITHLDLTPQLAMTLQPEEAPSLRVFITGGELLRSQTVSSWGDTGVLFNFYGPTELTIGCTVLKQVRSGARPSNIGTQFDSCSTIVMAVLAPTTPALIGGLGDLVVGGNQVARGYQDLPDATQKRFRHDNRLQCRTYITGDLVRLLATDRSFDFVGRADSQIKLRGQRIETSEIDNVLKKAHHQIKEVTTTVLQHPVHQKEQLVSFIVTDSSTLSVEMVAIEPTIALTDVVRYCKRYLPKYMVPAYIVSLNALKLTATHKIDSRSLSGLYQALDENMLAEYSTLSKSNSDRAKSLQPSKESMEIVLRSIKAMTNTTQVDVHQSIFAYGLDSVSVIGLVKKLRDAGYSACSSASLMAADSIEEMVYDLEMEDSAAKESMQEKDQISKLQQAVYKSIDEALVQDVLPCTSLLEGLLVESLEDSSDIHMNSFEISAKPSLDLVRLGKAWDALIQHAPILRSTFVSTPEGIAHVVMKPEHFDIFSAVPSAMLRKPLVMLKTGIKTILTIHHALYDGYSLGLLLHDLDHLYQDPSKAVIRPYFDVAVKAINNSIAGHDAYWQKALDGARGHIVKRYGSKESHSIILLKEQQIDLIRYASSIVCTPVAVLQTAFSLTLRHLFNADTIFGLVVSGRNIAVNGIEDMIYPTFNTIPVFASTSNCSIMDMLKRQHKNYTETIRYENTPLRQIKKAVKAPKGPLMDAVLVFQRVNEHRRTECLELKEAKSSSAGFALALDITLTSDDGLAIEARCEDCGLQAKQLLDLFQDYLQIVLVGKTSTSSLPYKIEVLRQIELHSSRAEYSRNSNQEPDTRSQSAVRDQVAKLVDQPAYSLSIDDTFFQQGLDSIDVIRLVANLKSLYIEGQARPISVAVIMRYATIRSLADYLDSDLTPEDQSDRSAIYDGLREQYMSDDLDDVLPVSPLQAGMIAMSLTRPGLYMSSTLHKVNTKIGLAPLKRAWETIIERHSILRTSFIKQVCTINSIISNYLQLVHKSCPKNIFTQVDCAASDVQHTYRQISQGFSFSTDNNDVPLRIAFITTSEQNYFALMIHHALYDGQSLDLIMSELQVLLLAKELSEPTIPYRLLIEHIFATSPAKLEYFWVNYLKNCDSTIKSSPDSTKTMTRSSNSSVSMTQLRQLSKSIGITVQAVLQATFGIYLCQLHQKTDVLFGTIHSGRNFHADADRIIGPCMNTLVVRSRIDRNDSLASIALRHHDHNSDAADYIHMPLKRLQDKIGKGPLFDSLLVVSHANHLDSPHGLFEEELDSTIAENEFPLALECSLTRDKLEYTAVIRDQFLSATNDFIQAFDKLLASVVAKPDELLSDLTTLQFESDEPEKSHMDDIITNARESVIADIILNMLDQSSTKLLRGTSIFSLGFDSISVIELSRRLSKQGIHLSVSQILRHPTIMRMATINEPSPSVVKPESAVREAIISDRNIKHICGLLKIKPDAIDKIREASGPQKYFLAASHALQGARFMSNFVYTIDSEDVSKVEQRWKDVVRDQQILRTTFASSFDGAELFQVVLDRGNDVVELVGANYKDPERALDQWLSSEDFDIPDLILPPVRLTRLRLTQDENLLILSIHHALYDAQSLSHLIEFLSLGVPIGSSDYTKTIGEMIRPSIDIDAWTKHLAHANNVALEKPTSRSTDQQDLLFAGKNRQVSILDRKARAAQVTTQALLLAAIGHALAPGKDVVLGVYIGGRSTGDTSIDDAFGPIVNVLPVTVSSSRAIDETARQVHHDLVELQSSMQQTSYPTLHKALQLDTGHIDIAINILPRVAKKKDDNGILKPYGPLSAGQIRTIRKRYRDMGYYTISSYSGLSCIDPVMDIEVEMTEEQVNFGVFCSEGVMNEEEAGSMIDQIWKLIAV